MEINVLTIQDRVFSKNALTKGFRIQGYLPLREIRNCVPEFPRIFLYILEEKGKVV